MSKAARRRGAPTLLMRHDDRTRDGVDRHFVAIELVEDTVRGMSSADIA